MANQPKDTSDYFKFSKFSGPAPLLPSATLFEQISEAAQMIGRAQMSYGQALLRANAAILDAWLPKQAARADSEEGPAQAARESEFVQP